MSIAQLYPSASSENNENLYLSLARIAQVDGKVSEQEQALLNRVATRMGWNEAEQALLLERASTAVVAPVIDAEERLERMYALLRMGHIDGSISEAEQSLLQRYAIALGFPAQGIEQQLKHWCSLFNGQISLADFKQVLQ
ncbi:MAG: hypothetical protein NWP52_02630 [Flavobacteriaceae bacterium]|jgi:uncharacterized tellurite resistance protein B-like protein|nr:hypothetical protein [Flavobacteriaceae bacterium]MDP4674290.1 hypothetical protein [Flavobacteriaceae bacterium]MDP4754142.1 hypothetical protein [Flavobacteriaceae bacterium]MDP4794118.1 hypothetical protein [Flavobacteriaceae bacterium]MDP4885546.1 hypothetical protein [Flavobacteriaceae bacterium]